MSTFLQINEEIRVGKFNLEVIKRLAEGGFGFVDLVQDVQTRGEFVLKRCSIPTNETYEIVKKEIKMLSTFICPHIVKLLGSEIITKGNTREAFLLLEFCPGGHLLDRLNQRNGELLPSSSIYRIFGQLLLAMMPLHNHNPPVTHRDLKLENILFDNTGNLRLCDFGSCVVGHVNINNASSRSDEEEVIAKQTTQMYRAPELIDLFQRPTLTEKTDIWALGCIFYALSFLVHPFQDAGSLGILSAKITFPSKCTISEDAKTLCLRMLDMDPEARPTVNQIFDAISAISLGNPLPPYELSAEAIERKKDREIAAIRRESRNKKQATPQPPPPPSQGLSSNSVAARRLAAKQGQGSNRSISFNSNTSKSNIIATTTSSSFDAFEDNTTKPIVTSISNDFDPFAAPINVSAKVSNFIDDSFDPFATTSFISSQHPHHIELVSEFDVFASSSSNSNTSVKASDSFFPSSISNLFQPSSSSNKGSLTFDAFDPTSPSNTTLVKSSTLPNDLFTSFPTIKANDTFDPFDTSSSKLFLSPGELQKNQSTKLDMGTQTPIDLLDGYVTTTTTNITNVFEDVLLSMDSPSSSSKKQDVTNDILSLLDNVYGKSTTTTNANTNGNGIGNGIGNTNANTNANAMVSFSSSSPQILKQQEYGSKSNEILQILESTTKTPCKLSNTIPINPFLNNSNFKVSQVSNTFSRMKPKDPFDNLNISNTDTISTCNIQMPNYSL